MTSQLNVDTIKGKTAETSITIQGEGSATTNLQQGLAKAFLAYKGTATNEIYDSNNIASVTDNSTGKHTPNFTNNFNGADDYALSAFAQQDSGGGGRFLCGFGSPATDSRPIETRTSANSLGDHLYVNVAFHGDLA